MNTTEAAESKPSRGARMPRWMFVTLGLLAWLVVLPLVHGVLPWALSGLTTRHGWVGERPGAWNALGLLPVLFGVAVLVWDLTVGLTEIPRLPKRVAGLIPPILLTRGPYAFTRNPMYVAELALWLGWALLYGSLAVLLGFVILATGVAAVVPREERALERRFGAVYRQYKSTVPRWLGTVRR